MYTRNQAIELAKKNDRNSRIARANYDRWERSNDTELYHVYGSYSDKKISAMHYCRDMCRDFEGHYLRILGHNCNTFSVGFIFQDADHTYFAYITRDYDRYCILD